MAVTYVLIDFENVQPEGLSLLNGRPSYQVRVLVGATQKNVPVDKLVLPLLDLGERGKIIKVSETGPNALDFHIAFTLGQLSERETDACFRIISKDKGFDPLVGHLKGLGRDVARHDSVPAMLGVKQPPSKGNGEDVASHPVEHPRADVETENQRAKNHPCAPASQKKRPLPVSSESALPKSATTSQFCLAYLTMLKKPKATPPGTLSKLRKDIVSKNPGASSQTADAVVALLMKLKHITVDAAGKVTYALKNAPSKTSASTRTPLELCQLLIDKLDKSKNPKTTQPRSQTALASFIRSVLPKQQLTAKDVADIISAMHDKGFLTVNADGKIVWPAS